MQPLNTPVYIALSYSWGQTNDDAPVLCNVKTIRITGPRADTGVLISGGRVGALGLWARFLELLSRFWHGREVKKCREDE
jgi:hypothetical protein